MFQMLAQILIRLFDSTRSIIQYNIIYVVGISRNKKLKTFYFHLKILLRVIQLSNLATIDFNFTKCQSLFIVFSLKVFIFSL